MSTIEIVPTISRGSRQAATVDGPAFFPVSATKLAVMSVCTLGLYQIYWFYENWYLVKRRERSRISPPWRSVFGALFCYPLFRRVGSMARQQATPAPSALAFFIAWIGVSLLAYASGPAVLLSLGSVLFMLPVQQAANRINARIAPLHDRNRRLGAWNIVGVVIGGFFVLLSVIGSFIQPMPT